MEDKIDFVDIMTNEALRNKYTKYVSEENDKVS